jgi:hypothetical protein
MSDLSAPIDLYLEQDGVFRFEVGRVSTSRRSISTNLQSKDAWRHSRRDKFAKRRHGHVAIVMHRCAARSIASRRSVIGLWCVPFVRPT